MKLSHILESGDSTHKLNVEKIIDQIKSAKMKLQKSSSVKDDHADTMIIIFCNINLSNGTQSFPQAMLVTLPEASRLAKTWGEEYGPQVKKWYDKGMIMYHNFFILDGKELFDTLSASEAFLPTDHASFETYLNSLSDAISDALGGVLAKKPELETKINKKFLH